MVMTVAEIVNVLIQAHKEGKDVNLNRFLISQVSHAVVLKPTACSIFRRAHVNGCYFRMSTQQMSDSAYVLLERNGIKLFVISQDKKQDRQQILSTKSTKISRYNCSCPS